MLWRREGSNLSIVRAFSVIYMTYTLLLVTKSGLNQGSIAFNIR